MRIPDPDIEAPRRTLIAIRMVVTADNHLGRHYDRMPPQRLEQRRERLCRGFISAVDHAIQQEAHILLHLGDLFDSAEPRNLERQVVAHQLARLRGAGVRCVAIGGNHDTHRGRFARHRVSPLGAFAPLGALTLLGDPSSRGGLEVETLEIDGVRVALRGLAFDPLAPAGSDPLDGLHWRPEADVAILLMHGSLEGHVYPGAPEPIVRRRSVEGLKGVDLLLAGHVHRFATFRWGDTVVVIPGATEWMTFGEMDSTPGFAHIEVEEGGPPRVDHVEVECQPRRRLTVHTSELGEDPGAALRARVEELCDEETMVQLILEGPISRRRYHALKLREILELGSARCFSLDMDTAGLYLEEVGAPGAARGGRLSQREELIRYARERVEAASSPVERDLIEEALHTILEAYR